MNMGLLDGDEGPELLALPFPFLPLPFPFPFIIFTG